MSKLRILLLSATLSLSSCIFAQQPKEQLQQIFEKLDHTIAQAHRYINVKEDSIDAKRKALAVSTGDEQRYAAADALYHEYRSFDNDSALFYLYLQEKLARRLDRQKLAMTLLRIGHQHVIAGYYDEARNYLTQVDTDDLSQAEHATFYHYWSHFYRDAETHTIDPYMRSYYHQQAAIYHDSVALFSPVHDALYLQRRCIALCNSGDYKEARKVNEQWKKCVEPGTINYSLMAYYRAEISENEGMTDEQQYWLAVAAITEVESCDMNLTALWQLAEMIYSGGDIQRALRYIDFSWNSIARFSAHKRAGRMAPVMSNIHNSYQQQMKRNNRLLTVLAVTVALLAVVMLAMLRFASHERKIALKAKADLQTMNEQLAAINRQLNDSNRLKDEYISEFLQICSAYIEKLDGYRIRINRKLKANQLKDVMKMTESEQLKKQELEELMNHFDAVFLHLFPSFVDDFNALLAADARITSLESGRMNTLLRIFALVRLGIDESSKIADFLNYSANSIYNYRSRVKAHALCPRDEFEQRVKGIGISS